MVHFRSIHLVTEKAFQTIDSSGIISRDLWVLKLCTLIRHWFVPLEPVACQQQENIQYPIILRRVVLLHFFKEVNLSVLTYKQLHIVLLHFKIKHPRHCRILENVCIHMYALLFL